MEQHGMLRYGTVRYVTEHYGMVRYVTELYVTELYVTERYGTVRYGTLWNVTERYGTELYITERYRTVRYGTLRNGTVRHGTARRLTGGGDVSVGASLLEQGVELLSAGRLFSLGALSEHNALPVPLDLHPPRRPGQRHGVRSRRRQEILQPVVVQLQHVGRHLRRDNVKVSLLVSSRRN